MKYNSTHNGLLVHLCINLCTNQTKLKGTSGFAKVLETLIAKC